MSGKSKTREYLESLLIAVILALFVRSFVVEAFTIPSGSMEPTLLVGDYLLVNRLSYVMKVPFTDRVLLNLGNPNIGDTIVFRYPEDHTKDFIKRVIARGGDTVEIRDKVVYVNGSELRDKHAWFTDHDIIPRNSSERDNFGPVTVPGDSYFVMGDNRDNSLDSRFWGFVKRDELVGKAFILYFSWNGRSDDLFHRIRWERIAHLIR
ncbi:MAG TPA: signal peptidase I [Syntrophorhabdales bacterium]|nr:signal peptidase I [Syntrophorhabdales bacterium]